MNNNKKILITVHGIRTFGQWQNKLKRLVEEQSPNTTVLNYTYGYFSVLAFLIPPLRWLVVKRFQIELYRIIENNPDAPIDLVGHSFGTHLIAWALYTAPISRRPKIGTIILAGSVLKSNFDWMSLISTGHIKQIVNDCGINDSILVINQLFVLFTGMAGRIGFQGITGNALYNRYFAGGHSLYFEKNNVLSEQFMKEHWLPVLLESNQIPIIDQRNIPTTFDGIVETILQNAEVVKLSIYAAIIAIPLVIYFNLYQIAELERKRAEELLAASEQQKKDLAKSLISVINKTLLLPFDKYELDESEKIFFSFAIEKILAAEIKEELILKCRVGRFRAVRMPDDSSVLNSNALKNLLKNYEPFSLSSEYALALGEKNGMSIRDLFIINGYPSSSIAVYSYGKETPFVPYPDDDTDIDKWNDVAAKNNGCVIELSQRLPPQS